MEAQKEVGLALTVLQTLCLFLVWIRPPMRWPSEHSEQRRGVTQQKFDPI